MPTKIPEPWLSFLRDVDGLLQQRTEVHCLGAFVLSVLWGLPRPTGDIDIVEILPPDAWTQLMKVAGEGSSLAREHSLHFQRVSVAEYPEGYVSRLVDITPDRFHRLRLMAFEVHDLVLAKLARNSPRDRADVEFLARKGALDRGILEGRFDMEMRLYLLDAARETASLTLWLDEFLGNV